MGKLKSELSYDLSELQPIQEDDLAFAKGCVSGLLLATPLWVLIIVIIKLILK